MGMKFNSDNAEGTFPQFSSMNDYYKNFEKLFNKYYNMIRQAQENFAHKQTIIPADGNDICNYLARYNMANFQIQAILRIDGRLDYEKLVKAARLSVKAEPVFGCRFIKSNPPYWKPFKNTNKISLCSLEETDNLDEAIEKFLESPMDMDKDTAVKIKLIRSGKYDTLGFKINHVCCDGVGAKEYILLLSDIYSRVISSKEPYFPKQSIRNKKDHERLLTAFTGKKFGKPWSILNQAAFPTWNFPWKNMRIGSTRFVFSRLSYEHLDAMKSYAKARGATINDLILTAVFRAMFEISKPPYGVPMDIPITIDLRKFLPKNKAKAIRNLSGGIVVRLARKINESFEGTLSRVVSQTEKMRNRHPDIKNLIWLDYIEKMNFHQICAYFEAASQVIEMMSQNPFFVINMCSPILSNFGVISKSPIKFGNNVVTDAYIVPPVVRAPGILLVASTYNGIITLGAGYYEPSVRKSDMERLINKMSDELIKGCR